MSRGRKAKRFRLPARAGVTLLLDGEPMTRTALIERLAKNGHPDPRLPSWMEFDVCEHMTRERAFPIETWVVALGVPVKVVFEVAPKRAAEPGRRVR